MINGIGTKKSLRKAEDRRVIEDYTREYDSAKFRKETFTKTLAKLPTGDLFVMLESARHHNMIDLIAAIERIADDRYIRTGCQGAFIMTYNHF